MTSLTNRYANNDETISYLNSKYNNNDDYKFGFESPSNGHAGKYSAEIYFHGGIPDRLVENLTFNAKLTFANFVGGFGKNTDCTLNKLTENSKVIRVKSFSNLCSLCDSFINLVRKIVTCSYKG